MFGNQPEVVRCVAGKECVLVTYDVNQENLCSVVVSPLGLRLSSVIAHPRNVVLYPTNSTNGTTVSALFLSDGKLHRKPVLSVVSPD